MKMYFGEKGRTLHGTRTTLYFCDRGGVALMMWQAPTETRLWFNHVHAMATAVSWKQQASNTMGVDSPSRGIDLSRGDECINATGKVNASESVEKEKAFVDYQLL